MNENKIAAKVFVAVKNHYPGNDFLEKVKHLYAISIADLMGRNRGSLSQNKMAAIVYESMKNQWPATDFSLKVQHFYAISIADPRRTQAEDF